MSRLEVALATLLMSVPSCPSSSKAEGHAAGFGTKSQSLTAHMRRVTSHQRARGGNEVEAVQENWEKPWILPRRNHHIKSLQAGRWSKAGVRECCRHLLTIWALLYCGCCATTDGIVHERVSVPLQSHQPFMLRLQSHTTRGNCNVSLHSACFEVGCSCN